jgi:hypothetical protein
VKPHDELAIVIEVLRKVIVIDEPEQTHLQALGLLNEALKRYAELSQLN